MHNRLMTRSAGGSSQENLSTRSLSVRSAATSYDDTARSVRVIAVTENPVRVFDYDRYEMVNEILLISGMELPENGRLPLLDCHYRHSVDDVYGSARDFIPTEVDGVPASETGVFFSDDAKGRDLEGKVRDGHVTDFSIGYLTDKSHSYYIPEGQKQMIEGRAFEGPVIVRTKWTAKELSATPIGADEAAKARSDSMAHNSHKGEEPMPAELKKRQQEAALAERTRITAIRTRALAEGVDEATITGMIERGLSIEEADTEMAALPGKRGTEEDMRKRETEVALAERTRIGDIRKRGLAAGLEEAAIDGMIGRGLSLGDAALEIVDALEKRQAPALGAGRMEMGADERDKFRSAAADGLAIRSGIHVEKPAAGYEEFRGRSLERLAEECITRSGGSISGMGRNDIAKVALGMNSRSFSGLSTSDFPNLMSDVANRVLTDAHAEAEVTWNIISDIVDAADFRPINLVDMGGFPELQLVGENGEYKDVKFEEGKESYVVRRRGNMFRLTYEMVRNDDLRAFLRIPKMFGSAAHRTVNNAVYGLLSSDPTMGDGKKLYHASRENLVTGDFRGIPSVSALSEGRRLMRRFKDLGGKAALNLSPKFLVCGSKHENNVDVILASAGLPQEHMSSTVTNPWKGRLTPVIDAVLDSYDENAWYLMPAVNSSPVIEVAFLDGEQTPYLDSELDFDSDGIKYKCRHSFGAGLVGSRLVKNAGII